jgi:uncharacterized membrane protein
MGQQVTAMPSYSAADVPRISLRANWWIVVPIAALVLAIRSHVTWFLNYVHVFSAILWTGTDIFMGFILGPVLRRVDFATRRAIIVRLMPRMVFYMLTVSTVTITAGWYLADWMGLFRLSPPQVYWLWATLTIVTVMFIQGVGILLPTNLMVYFELLRDRPDGEKIQRLMRRYLVVVASQGVLQFAIIFIMAKFATGV